MARHIKSVYLKIRIVQSYEVDSPLNQAAKENERAKIIM